MRKVKANRISIHERRTSIERAKERFKEFSTDEAVVKILGDDPIKRMMDEIERSSIIDMSLDRARDLFTQYKLTREVHGSKVISNELLKIERKLESMDKITPFYIELLKTYRELIKTFHDDSYKAPGTSQGGLNLGLVVNFSK